MNKEYEINVPEGKYWAISTNTEKEPDLVESSFLNQRSLYAGAAGIGYFFVQVYEATGNKVWLDDALKVGEYLIATYEKRFSEDPGLYSGTSGEGIFLNLLYEKTGEEKYRKQAVRIADDIYDTVVKDETGIHWKGFYDLMGDAGSVIYWLLIAQKTGIKKYIGYAKEVLDSILKLGVSDENGATYWKLFDPSIYFKTLPEGGLVPNFAHGTAGVIYLLTKYYEATGEESYLEEAKKGYQFLKKYLRCARRTADKSIADAYKDEKGYRWYNAWTRIKPWDVDAHLGLYIGAAGSASALLALYAKLTGIKITSLFEYDTEN